MACLRSQSPASAVFSLADPAGWKSHHQWCPQHRLVHTPHKISRRRTASVIRTAGSPRMEAVNTSPAGEGLRRPAGPRLLKLLNKDQIVFIGNSIYGLELVNIPSIYKDVLIADIAAAMLGNPGCGCAGPDTPCTPDTHMFSPDIFPGLPVAQGGADIGSLLGAVQQDGLVTQPEAQFTNGLPPVSLNPVMPVADQRRSLLSSLGSASPSRALQQIQRDGLRTSLGVNVPSPPRPPRHLKSRRR